MIDEHLKNFNSLFNFAVRGIEEHLNNDRTEPEMITGALEALTDLLAVTMVEMEGGQNDN